MPSPVQDIDDALAALRQAAGGSAARVAARPAPSPLRRRRWGWRILGGLLGLAVLLVLPLVVLVRASVMIYHHYALPGWVALAIGAALTTVLLMGYGVALSWKARQRARAFRVVRRLALALVVAYCGYALLYLSAGQAKTAEVQQTYTRLHPLLRLGVGTLLLVDQEAVVTDTDRRPEDYARMGLPALERSLHYAQADGYAHAVDLRTTGRAEWKNTLVVTYFEAMGFRTLRHVGTADHLHVSMPRP